MLANPDAAQFLTGACCACPPAAAPPPGAGSVEVPPELAQELLEASDQYMLETLKRLCEMKIKDELEPDNVSAVGGRGAGGWGERELQ